MCAKQGLRESGNGERRRMYNVGIDERPHTRQGHLQDQMETWRRRGRIRGSSGNRHFRLVSLNHLEGVKVVVCPGILSNGRRSPSNPAIPLRNSKQLLQNPLLLYRFCSRPRGREGLASFYRRTTQHGSDQLHSLCQKLLFRYDLRQN